MELRNGPVWRIDWYVNRDKHGTLHIEQYESMCIDTESDQCFELVNMQGMAVASVGASERAPTKGWCSTVVTTTAALHTKLLRILLDVYVYSEAQSIDGASKLLETLQESVSTLVFDPGNN